MNNHNNIRSAPTTSMIAFLTLLLLSPFAMAESDAVATMAGIVSEMNHFPSDEQKETLAAISKDGNNSEATRTIAGAIRNIEHKVQSKDVGALKDIVADSSASEAERKLAVIVMDFHHQASSKTRQTLEVLSQQ